MMRTFRRLLFGLPPEESEELIKVRRKIAQLELQAKRLESDKRKLRLENHVAPRLEWIFTKGAK